MASASFHSKQTFAPRPHPPLAEALPAGLCVRSLPLAFMRAILRRLAPRLSPFRVLHFPTFARDRGVPGVWLSSVAGDVGVVGDDGVVKPPGSFSY
jgi:hypothetical protein